MRAGCGEAMTEPEVDVIIGSRNGKEHLVRCLDFVYAQEYGGRIHTVVVDNDSHDASVFAVSSRYPQVHLIENKEDLGRAAAYNQALAGTKGRFVLFLAQDVEIAPDFVARQVEFFLRSNGLGGLGARIHLRRKDVETKTIDSLGMNLRGAQPVLFGHDEDPSEIPAEALEIFAPASSASFWDRECLEKVAPDGLVFDEELINGYITLDLAWQARWLGFRIWSNPLAQAVHQRGVLWRRNPERKRQAEFLRIRGRLLCYRKNLLFQGWSRFGKTVRSAVRKEIFKYTMAYGAGFGADLWLSGRRSMKVMFRKAKRMEGRVAVPPESIFRDIFSFRAASR